jgi:hypothetical protein
MILGYLHLDHAGGFEYFVNTDVEIYVHELERKHALYSVAIGSDNVVYMPHYSGFNLNWMFSTQSS